MPRRGGVRVGRAGVVPARRHGDVGRDRASGRPRGDPVGSGPLVPEQTRSACSVTESRSTRSPRRKGAAMGDGTHDGLAELAPVQGSFHPVDRRGLDAARRQARRPAADVPGLDRRARGLPDGHGGHEIRGRRRPRSATGGGSATSAPILIRRATTPRPIEQRTIIALDPPTHTWVRRLNNLAMAPAAIDEAIPYIAGLARADRRRVRRPWRGRAGRRVGGAVAVGRDRPGARAPGGGRRRPPRVGRQPVHRDGHRQDRQALRAVDRCGRRLRDLPDRPDRPQPRR